MPRPWRRIGRDIEWQPTVWQTSGDVVEFRFLSAAGSPLVEGEIAPDGAIWWETTDRCYLRTEVQIAEFAERFRRLQAEVGAWRKTRPPPDSGGLWLAAQVTPQTAEADPG